MVLRRPGQLLAALVCLVSRSHEATLGDGTRSLYTGRLIDAQASRGSCEVDGLTYPSETAIPRDHPCHYCICFQAQVSCYWKQCTSPPEGCAVLHLENVCNPSLYICKIPEKAKPEPKLEFGARLKPLRRRRFRRQAPLPPGQRLLFEEFTPLKFDEDFVKRLHGSQRMRRAISASDPLGLQNRPPQRDKSCTILGVTYQLGELIGVASDVCMECRCAAGEMYCSPKCCFSPTPFHLSPRYEENLINVGKARAEISAPHPLSYIRHQYELGNR